MNVFFDPFSLTYHFNNNIVDTHSVKLYNSERVKSWLLRKLYALLFYIKLFTVLFNPTLSRVVFNISVVPLLDAVFVFFLRLRKVRVILILHNIDVSRNGMYLNRSFCIGILFRLVNKIVIHSSLEHFKNRFGSVYVDKVIILSLPVRSAGRGQLSRENGVLRFLFIGIVDFYKGLDRLVEYFIKLDKPVALSIVGVHSIDISETILRLKENAFISLEIVDDYISQDVYDFYLEKSDVILLPYRECSGSAVLTDAIAKGKFILASNLEYFNNISNKYARMKVSDFKSNSMNEEYVFISKNLQAPYTLNFLTPNQYFLKLVEL